MQSFLGASGGLARTIGPSLVTFMYIEYGPRWTFLCANGFILISITLFIYSYKKIIPYHLFIVEKKGKEIETILNEDLLIDQNLNETLETNTEALDLYTETNENNKKEEQLLPS